MVDPYRMVVVNVFASLLLLGGILFYRYIFPKKNLNLLLLILIISLLPLISLLRKGAYESGDFNIHVYRAISFYESLQEGYIIPSWSKSLNAGFGYPLFLFLNLFPYYIIACMHAIGLSFIASLKLYLSLCYLLSGIGMWYLANMLYKKTFPAFTATILYQFAPYHFVDLSFRAALGEVTAFAILPFFLAVLFMLLQQTTFFRIVLSGTVFALFVLSHQGISVLSLLIAIPFVMHYKPKKIPLRRIAIPLLTTMLISAVLSSPVWIPHVIYAPFFSGPLNASVTFPKLQDLFFSPWRYGLLFQGPKGELSFAVGYVHLLFMALAIIILWRNKNQTSKHLKFWLFCTGLLFFLLIPYSSIVWKTIPLIHTVQFATRLLILITLCLSLIGGYTAMFLQKEQRILIILIALSIMLTILNWGHRRVIPEISDSTLYKLLETSTAQGEGLARLAALKWLDENDPWQKKKPDSPLRVIKGKASYQLLERKSQLHRYRISVEEDAVFSENTLFFPNWRIFIDNKIIPAQYTVDSIKGMLRFSLPKGYYTVRIEFIDDYFVKTSKLFSLLGFSLIIPFFTYHIIFRHRK